MSTKKQLEVLREDPNAKKWCVALRDEVFKSFLSHGNPSTNRVFSEGSLFSPFLFGKFFDPSDAFPLWEFESEILLCKLRSSELSSVDWFGTDQEYVLKAELHGIVKNGVQVYVAEQEKAVEICGQWNPQRAEAKSKDWRSGHWWESGCVRKVELPDDADWKRVEAYLTNDTLLEIKIPKKNVDFDANVSTSKNSDQV